MTQQYCIHTSPKLAKLPKLPWIWRIAGSGALRALEEILTIVWTL